MKLRKLLSMVLALCLCASLMVPMSSAASTVTFGVEGPTATQQLDGTYNATIEASTTTDGNLTNVATTLDTLAKAEAFRVECEMTFNNIALDWTNVSLSNFTMTAGSGVFVADSVISRTGNTLKQTYKLTSDVLSGWEGKDKATALNTVVTFKASPTNFTISSSNGPTVTVNVYAVLGSVKKLVAQGTASLTVTPSTTISVDSVSLRPKQPQVGKAVTAEISPANATPKSYQWYVNGAEVEGAISATYTPDKNDYNKTIYAVVTYFGGETSSDTSTKVGQAPAVKLTSDQIKTTVTKDSITVEGFENSLTRHYEYSVDGTTWQNSPVFTGLVAGKAYTVRVRTGGVIDGEYTESWQETGAASQTATKTVTTDKVVNGKVKSKTSDAVSVTLRSVDTDGEDFDNITLPDPLIPTGSPGDEWKIADFSFTANPSKNYNLIAEQTLTGGKKVTMTQLVLAGESGPYELLMPAGDYSSVVEVKPDTPPVLVGGLETVAEANKSNDGDQSVTVIMTVEQVDDSTANMPETLEESLDLLESKIESDIKDENVQVDYLDINITREVVTREGGVITETSTDPITETGNNVITILIPYDMAGKTASKVKMYRHHGDDAEAKPLNKSNTAKDGNYYVDADNNVIYLYANRFSTYAIVYSSQTTGGSTGGGGGGGTVTYVGGSGDTQFKYCAKNKNCPMSAYTDISPKEWYHDGVHWALENGVMNGMTSNTFEPTTSTTRAMVAVMLWRMEGEPEVEGDILFSDVDESTWYADGIRWATESGVITGYSGAEYGPDDPVTREQLATMLYRYAAYKGVSVSVGKDNDLSEYSDAASISSYALPAVKWADASGIMNGLFDDNGFRILAPKEPSYRTVVATMFMRYCTLVIK